MHADFFSFLGTRISQITLILFLFHADFADFADFICFTQIFFALLKKTGKTVGAGYRFWVIIPGCRLLVLGCRLVMLCFLRVSHEEKVT